MVAAERNFNTFELGDHPSELANGLIVDMADDLGVDLVQPNGYGNLVGALGAKKTLQENPHPTDVWTLEQAADMVDQSGIQLPMNRKLWVPSEQADPKGHIFITGAVANWQDRTAKLVGESPQNRVHIAVGNRAMTTPTEVSHPEVVRIAKANDDVAPTETQYAWQVVRPSLRKLGKVVTMHSYDTESGSEIAQKFAHENYHLFEEGKEIVVARVANAGVQLALQFRQGVKDAAKAIHGEDMADPDYEPQISIITDTLPAARTQEQLASPKHYQNPYNALRQVAVTAKLMHEFQQEKRG